MGVRRYFKDNVIKDTPAGERLVGYKCIKCGKLHFPKTDLCHSCYESDFEETILSTTGKLYSYTVACAPSGNFLPPHAMGYVDLPEGIRIFTLLANDKEYEVGMDLEFEMAVLWTEDDIDIVGFKFKPM